MFIREFQEVFYAGLGINYDGHSKINDESLDTTLPGINATSHYKYSITYGLPLTSYRAFGIAFNILHDSRNNAINASSGSFAQLSFRVNPAFMNNVGSSSLYYEYRTYFDFSKANRLKHVLAFWTWGQFQTNGRLPYLELPSITWDMYNRSGRGYIQGRIRGDNLVYGEAEYRFPITANGLLGGTAFFNAATASSDINNQKLGADYAPGYGVGLRIKMDKKTNTNITIDYGWGRNGSSALYFNLQEAF